MQAGGGQKHSDSPGHENAVHCCHSKLMVVVVAAAGVVVLVMLMMAGIDGAKYGGLRGTAMH